MANERTSLLSSGKAASFGRALEPSPSPSGGPRLPQAIAHRGYKAAFPENSMAAMRGAVECGAHAVETDLHLSRDGVVVLSHDPSLKRCFGVNRRVADCDWAFLSTLRTTRAPHEPLARLSDLLEYLGCEENERIWVLLDVKIHDDAEDLMTKTAETLAAAATTRPWSERVLLGGWNANYLRLFHEILPDYSAACICFSVLYARIFLHGDKYANVDFNMTQRALVGPFGARFRAAVRRADRNLYAWTVNDAQWMEWCIRKGVDGVVTDDPKLFLEMCRRWKDGPGGGEGKELLATAIPKRSALRTARLYFNALALQVLTFVLVAVFWRWLSSLGSKKQKKEQEQKHKVMGVSGTDVQDAVQETLEVHRI